MNKLLAQIDFSKLSVPSSGGQLSIDQNLKLGDILTIIFQVYIFYIAGIILLIYLVIGGFQFMFSRGEPKAMQAAQAKITNAVVGFVIVFLSFLIIQIIAKVFGIDETLFGTVLGIQP